jgi:O-antigen/teichoic acid export membrane protein
MKRTTSHVFQHVLWRGLYFFSILLINIGIARFFAAEKSGQIFFIVNNLALVLLIVSLSLESGATFYVASGSLDASLMANFCLVWATGASLIALAGWWAVLYFSHSNYVTDPLFLMAGFFFILGVLFTTYFTALFYAKKEFGLPNKILFGVNMILLIFIVTGRNISILRLHFIEIYFFCFFLQGILLRIFFLKKYTYRGGLLFPSGSVLKKVFQFSIFALAANLVYFLVNRIDYWFVQYYCSAKDLGNYIQASKLAQMLLILPAILGSTLFPIFSSRENSGNKSELTAVIRVMLWINGGICLLVLCSGWFVIPLVFGPSFSNMYLLFVLLIPGIMCITMNYPVAAWFSARKRVEINIYGSLIGLVVICSGDFFILPRYGILAAPVISSAGYFSFYFYTIYIYRKENAVPLKEFLVLQKSDLQRIRHAILHTNNDLSTENFMIQKNSAL